MEVTSDLSNWLRSHTDLFAKEKAPSVTPSPGREFVDFLWPAGLPYASPLYPAFLTELGGPVARAQVPVCMARDGLVPLLWFFRQFPEPKAEMGWLFVHTDLAAYVPTPWRKITGQYQMQSDRSVERKQVDSLLLTGIMMDAYCDISDLEERLENICADLGVAKANIGEVLAFIPTRNNGYGMEHRHDFAIDYVSALSRCFGSKLKGINWNRFDSTDHWKGFAVADLTSRFICADSFLFHRAAGKGALIIGEGAPIAPPKAGATRGPKETQSWVPLSPFHGARISLPIGGKGALETDNGLPDEMKVAFEKRFMTAMSSKANLRFPWPSWFVCWAKNATDERKKKRPRSRDN